MLPKVSRQVKKVSSPHDRYFQRMMEDKDVALSFISVRADSELRQAMDQRTFAIADVARRPVGKKSLYTDITYYVLIKGHKGYIYLHVEHERG
ncbi:MAG: Rpn family recombination-promoting nuclease/putative transposase, partial [Bacteroidota bacterium]